MSKNYLVQFGSGNPSFATGLSPTFTRFVGVPGGATMAPPGITEIPNFPGMYYFTTDMLTVSGASTIAFLIDGTASLSPGSLRYIAGNLDPVQSIDEIAGLGGASLTGLGASFNAFGTSLNALIGTTASSFGSTAADPATVFGFLKRQQEFNEGDSVFTKTSGLWDIYARGNAVGASTQLIEKTLVDNGTTVTKT